MCNAKSLPCRLQRLASPPPVPSPAKLHRQVKVGHAAAEPPSVHLPLAKGGPVALW